MNTFGDQVAAWLPSEVADVSQTFLTLGAMVVCLVLMVRLARASLDSV